MRLISGSKFTKKYVTENSQEAYIIAIGRCKDKCVCQFKTTGQQRMLSSLYTKLDMTTPHISALHRCCSLSESPVDISHRFPILNWGWRRWRQNWSRSFPTDVAAAHQVVDSDDDATVLRRRRRDRLQSSPVVSSVAAEVVWQWPAEAACSFRRQHIHDSGSTEGRVDCQRCLHTVQENTSCCFEISRNRVLPLRVCSLSTI